MGNLKIQKFCGLKPRVEPTLLADGMAIKAHNCILKNGKLVPIRKPTQNSNIRVIYGNGLLELKNAQSLFVIDRGNYTSLLGFPGIVHCTEGNVADDPYTRVFLSGATGVGTNANEPCVLLFGAGANGADVWHSLCKTVLSAPTVTLGAGGNADTDNTRYTVFYQTWVDAYGYESGCSQPSAELSYNDGDSVTIAAETIPSGAVKRRIYKLITGTENGIVQLVAEYDTNPFDAKTLTVKDEDAAEEMPEFESPKAGMKYMSFVDGGFYVGFRTGDERTIRFSDIENPSNWPTDYAYSINENAKAIAVTSNSVFVLTDGRPYVLSGTAPESMTVTDLVTSAPCVSERSVCVYNNAVYYASHEGIAYIYNDADEGTQIKILTREIFTYDQWQALNPSSCLMVQYHGRLFCHFNGGSGSSAWKKSIIVDLNETECSVTTHDDFAVCAAVDDTTDSLYFVSGRE